MKKKSLKTEHREYLRLDSIFPVEYQFLKDNAPPDESWHHGFTHNVSKGGMCLELLKLDVEIVRLLKSAKGIRLNLRIHIPIHRPAGLARARVLWFKEEPHHLSQYRVGLVYDEIEQKVIQRIMRLAYGKIVLPRLALISIAVLFFGFITIAYNNFRLSSYNKKLIKDLVDITQGSKTGREELERIRSAKQALESRLQEAGAKIKEKESDLENKLKALEEYKKIEKEKTELLQAQETEVQRLKSMLIRLSLDEEGLRQKIGNLEKMEVSAQDKLKDIKERRMTLEKESFQKMYQWVKIHQNPRTGLISSFEGGELSDVAFTYDQALAVIVFSYFKDYNLAKKILDFYLNKAKQTGGFYNGYYSQSTDVAEFVVHSGPNLWLGIAVLHYTKLSGDNQYLPMARNIAQWMMKLQDEDAEGGLRGGPQAQWYSTEHNLDGFAFFNMFYKISKEPLYRKASEEIFGWLKAHAYDSPQVPIKRGRGDATIATDTYAWSIASLGPARLTEIGMDPEAIMKFAEDNCAVEVDFIRPNGEVVRVKGFDFAKQQHLARGAVISSEWTAQMALSYAIVSEYFSTKKDVDKERFYKNKAEEYLEELSKMVISSPSRTGQGEGCLPYASKDFVDTGHGWRTPKGMYTGSLSATIYTIFAYYRFNPLQLN
jgi:hypothetical protein